VKVARHIEVSTRIENRHAVQTASTGVDASALIRDLQRHRIRHIAGCDDFATKPIEFAALLDKISRLLAARPMEPAR